jgi:DNA invertase Pin-like site-specific DNA recombinase
MATQDSTGRSTRVACYARISTLNHQQDPELQLAEIRDFCHRRGWEITGEYVDRGISGSRERRPELDRMLAHCRKRRVDAVVVYRYDRAARSLRQLVNLLEEFRSLGIDFVSLHEGVDTSTPNGRLVFGIFASIAEFERELIRSRVRSGLALARARGKRLGRPAAKLDVELINSRRAAGASWRALSRELGCHATTILRAAARCAQNPAETAVLSV